MRKLPKLMPGYWLNWNNLSAPNLENRQETVRLAANTSRRRSGEDGSLLLLA
jgi:hypothetical protein